MGAVTPSLDGSQQARGVRASGGLVRAPYVSTVEELEELVEYIKGVGEFSFDVETRGNIHKNSEVLAQVEQDWEEKQASLKSTHPSVIARSRQAIEDRWTGNMALDPLRNDVFWIGLATEGMSWAVPMGHPNGEILVEEVRGDGSTVPPSGYRDLLSSGKESLRKSKYHIPAVFTPPPTQLDQETVFKALEPLFFDDNIVKVNQNIKFDCKSIAKYYGGQLPTGRYIDTLILMHILDENLMRYDLGSIIKENFAGHDPYAADGKIGATITSEAFSKATAYVHRDARWAWLLYRKMYNKICKVEGLHKALMLDIDCIRPVAQMEMNGIHVNTRMMTNVGKDLDMDINNCLREISFHSFPGFNPDSNNDLATLLFNKTRIGKGYPSDYIKGLGLKPAKLTAGGKPSTDRDTLGKLKGKHEVIQYLLDYSELKKLKSTYVEGLTPMLHRSRLHPQFHFHRTATGRFASSGPNLQNIPRDTKIRSLFTAGEGETLIVADYSQIEMRIMGMFSQDQELLRIFADPDIDLHEETAKLILGKDEVSGEERQIFGKTPNFLMGYGGFAKKLVESTKGHLTEEQAQEVINKYNSAYAGMTDWKRDVLDTARSKGYVETLYGRRRRVPDILTEGNDSDSWRKRSRAERQAINAVVQGTAAEIMKEAIVNIDGILPFPTHRMLVQVHDEVVVSVPSDEVFDWKPRIETAMGNGRTLMGVPLEVEAGHALSWAEAK
jgi:DNA polymerase-1